MYFHYLSSLFILGLLWTCKTPGNNQEPPLSKSYPIASPSQKPANYFVNKRGDTIQKIKLSNEEWQQKLNPKEYNVLREKDTERPFTGDLLSNKENGIYTCRGCGLPLFRSKHKFDSGTGWPSFFDVDDPNAIHKDTDYDLGYPRTELTCNKCGGHLGHVFEDGPPPTGLRYCINAVSLDFVKELNAK
jgi:peptide-methionine (R)-S-oxide reductase